MRKILLTAVKSLAYIAAAMVILLALAVGLFRLLLPQLPEYQENIKTWANAAIGMQVEFDDMAARWRLSGPELSFRDAELTRISILPNMKQQSVRVYDEEMFHCSYYHSLSFKLLSNQYIILL